MNWAINLLRPYRYWLLPAILTAIFFGCLTEQEPDTFSLPEQFVDSLSRYDSVHIILKDSSGKTLDLLFHGKVVSAAQLKNLPAPHAIDAKMRVTIIGYQGGQVTYLVDRIYDGVLNQIESHQPLILPTSKISFGIPELHIQKKTTLPFPAVSVEPAHLTDKTLLWASSNPMIFQIEEKGLRGIAPGTAYLQVSLRSDTAKQTEIPITVIPNPKLPDSLDIAPDTLTVALKGRTGQFTVQAFPLTASAVSWHIEDSTVASITGEGQVQGLKRGTARVRVVSKEDETIEDWAMVAVSDPVPVERVRLLNTKLELFVEGAAEMLRTETLPAEANPEVTFSVRDTSIARVLEGRILGLSEGETFVFARSLERPTKSDSLRVKVYPPQKVDSIRLSPDTLKLYTGGESKALQVRLYPSTLAPLIQWTSASSAIASVDSAGKVSPNAVGKTWVTAMSQVDSGKKAISLIWVKRDVPILEVGRDTTIPVGRTMTFSPKVTQEYGTVTRFKWDLNGDGTWDDSSAELQSVTYKYDQEKEVAALFYVRDLEGNDTLVVKRVKAVTGPVINIFSPLNNAYTNTSPVAVVWSVDGKDQEVFLKETLKEGANTVTRTAKDGLGNVYSASITVYYDTTAPNKPIVKGPVKTASITPTWTWSSGGQGGMGVYRLNVDKEVFAGVVETKDSTFTWEKGFTEGIYTLYVQERDISGNWSASGKFSVTIDLTPPGAPDIVVSPISPTNDPTPTWTWTSGGNGGKGWFRYKLDDSVLSVGGVAGTGRIFQPILPGLKGGTHTLFVQEQDTAGNWSPVASKEIAVDLTPPLPPIVFAGSIHTTNLKPTWQWSRGGAGGVGNYRYKLNDTNMQAGSVLTEGTSFTPSVDLSVGTQHTLYVQERDSAGNWSRLGFFRIKIHGLTGYAVGATRAIVKTTNGGITWNAIQSGIANGPNSEDLASLYFTDANTGYAVGTRGIIIKTINGGTTWSLLPSRTDASLTSVYFTNAKTGYAMKENGGIIKTNNGGASWDSLERQTSQYLGSVFFVDSLKGVAVGGAGTILKTSNGGMNWESVSISTKNALFSIFFIDDSTGFASGVGGTIIRTTNGGSTWSVLTSGTNLLLLSVNFTSKDIGFAAGEGGIILKTMDGGDHWAESISGTTNNLYSIYFTDLKTGYISGSGGTILKTTDGGINWMVTTDIAITGTTPDGLAWGAIPNLLSVSFP